MTSATPRQAPLLECISNVSEGRRPAVITALTTAITSTPGVRLLHRDSGVDANRTVFTFVGERPADVVAAAKALAQVAVAHIDLRDYQGTHPYIGALDVCPFVPLYGMPKSAALNAAKTLSLYLANELSVPVYAYEQSSIRTKFKSLARVRRGGLSSIASRPISDAPDFGSALPHPTAGVSVVGARDVLVAYNINLHTPGLTAAAAANEARHIAATLRSSSKSATRLPALRAIGWWQESFGCAQISCNLPDYHTTGLADVYEAVRAQARARGFEVAGSELIGMVPKEVLAEAGRSYDSQAWREEDAMKLAVQQLGLKSVRDFVLEERVL